jgi:hypothetical protein
MQSESILSKNILLHPWCGDEVQYHNIIDEGLNKQCDVIARV